MEILLSERLSVALTTELRAAVDRAATTRGISAPDFVRRAITGALTVDGQHVMRLPDLQRGQPARGAK